MENSEDLFQTALKYHQVGNLSAAERWYHKVLEIEPGQVAALFLLGAINLQTGNLDRASTLLEESIALKPDNAEAHNILGAVLQKQGKFDEAINSYENALKREPGRAEIYNNLGTVFIELGRADEAVEKYRHAIVLKPDYAEAYYNLANVLKRERKMDEAIKKYRRAIDCNPNYGEAHNNLGVTLKDQGRYDEALVGFQRAISLNPNHAEAHNNCGIVLQEEGRFDEALVAFDKAIAIRGDYAEAHFNRSMLLLLKGRFAEAWSGYERRLGTQAYGLKTFQQPKWDGSPLKGRSIIVHSEQGFGDTIQFVRYLPLIQSKGGNVIFECWPQLIHLLKDSKGINEIVEKSACGESVKGVDFQIPLLSLPGIFNTTLETIPARVPYIVADPKRVEKWNKRLSGNDFFTIGIVWTGNPENRNICLKKSCALSAFTRLSKISGVKFYSLQKGPASVETENPPDGMDITNLEKELVNFSETAAVIANLDLVISVDTAVAHIAGALDRAVWTLLPYVPDWRWLVDRDDTPWYPSMRLFRQTNRDDWDGVFKRVEQALTEKMLDHYSNKRILQKPPKNVITDHKSSLLQDISPKVTKNNRGESPPHLPVGKIQGHQSTISLCMIVKDEERNIARCLESVNQLVDEMVIVDTGSTDRTVEIAQRYGAQIYYHRWENNFSKARNFSLQYATSEWILILDADEELNRSDISRLKKLLEGNDYSAVSLVVKNRSKNSHNESYTNSIRLFRNYQGTRYDGIVHNVLKFRGTCLQSSISITHYGYNLSEEEMETKFLRTSSLLKEQIRMDPNNPVPYRYLGILYLEKAEYGKAVKESKIALEFAEKRGLDMRDFLISLYVIGAACYELGNLQEAETYAQKLVGIDKRYLDGFCILAFVYDRLGKYDNFLKASEKYLTLLDGVTKEPKGYSAVTFHTIGQRWKIHLLRGFFYLSHNQRAEADVEIEKAVGDTPDMKGCLALLGDFYSKNNYIDKAEEVYLRLLDISGPSAETLFKIGQVKVKQGDLGEAISFLRRAVDIDPYLYGVRLLICKINVMLDNFEDIVTDCDLLLKALNLPRNITLTRLEDLGDIFETIGNTLYERGDVQSAQTAFHTKNDLKQIQCNGRQTFNREYSIS